MEKELKYLLSEKGFRRLQVFLKDAYLFEKKQENTYWDTPERALGRRRAALRIRRVGRQSTLTFKQETTRQLRAGASVRKEIEWKLRPGTAHVRALPTAIRRALNKQIPGLELSELRKTVSLKTRRFGYRLAGGLVLELDAVTLSRGARFFEAELESSRLGPARKQLLELFCKVGIRPRPLRRTKLARAVRERRK